MELDGWNDVQVRVLGFVNNICKTQEHVAENVNLNCGEAVEALLTPDQEVIENQVGYEISAFTTGT